MNTRQLWYVVGAVVILMIIAFSLHRPDSPAARETFGPTASGSVDQPASPSASAAVTPQVSLKIRATPRPVPTPVYEDIAQQYTGRRIEFDRFCQATPTDNTFKDGTEVMLGNRSTDIRVISLKGILHSIPPYGFEIVTMTDTDLPVTWVVDCGNAKKVAKIEIQPLEPSPTFEPSPTASASLM